MEKARKVRAIEYANGVRRAPLWIAYVLFDLLPVVIISIIVTIEMGLRMPWIGTTLIMLPVLILYGLAAILLGYVISHFFNGPLKSFLMVFMINILMFIFAALAFGVSDHISRICSLQQLTSAGSLGTPRSPSTTQTRYPKASPLE